jgi:uncharacterized OsmC-like protein
MTANEIRAAQAPLKARYRAEPAAAQLTLTAQGAIDANAQVCRVETHIGGVVGGMHPTPRGEEAGLHPATGGDGSQACSGDMLLQALVACAGVTLGAVATAMGVDVRGGRVWAEGDLDFRGTLAVSREAAVGFDRIRLRFDLETDAPADTVSTLIDLTERYCVVLQTLRKGPEVSVSAQARAGR